MLNRKTRYHGVDKRVDVTYVRMGDEDWDQFDKDMDKFMGDHGFKGWASGMEMKTHKRDLSYEKR